MNVLDSQNKEPAEILVIKKFMKKGPHLQSQVSDHLYIHQLCRNHRIRFQISKIDSQQINNILRYISCFITLIPLATSQTKSLSKILRPGS